MHGSWWRVALSALGLATASWLAAPAWAEPPELRQRQAAYTVLDRDSRGEVAALSTAVVTSIHAPFGLPWIHPSRGESARVEREGYVLAHSSRDRTALWVCERIAPRQLRGRAVRRTAFAADPLLRPDHRAELTDYRYSGFDRGHLAAAADQKKVQRLKDETFYLSNTAPQVPAFNQRIWAGLEREIRRWVKRWGTVYAITGGFFFDPREEDPTTADGLVEHWMVGRVSVPTHFYKVVLRRDGAGWKALTFVLENRPYENDYSLKAHLRTVDWLEERARLNFFPGLAPEVERRLEQSLGCWESWQAAASAGRNAAQRRGTRAGK